MSVLYFFGDFYEKILMLVYVKAKRKKKEAKKNKVNPIIYYSYNLAYIYEGMYNVHLRCPCFISYIYIRYIIYGMHIKYLCLNTQHIYLLFIYYISI